MINFRRLSKYLLAYIILMIASALIANISIIRPIDLAVYEKYYLNSYLSNYSKELKEIKNEKESNDVNKEINDKIIFIDIPTYDDSDHLKKLRKNIADLLYIIDSKVNPKMSDLDKPVIILDIAFRNDPVGLDSIKSALMSLREKKVKVYAPYKLPEKKNTSITFNEHNKEQNKSLYNIYFEGRGKRLNTAFDNHLEVNGLLSYNSFEKLGDSIIKSLPIQVAIDFNRNEKEIDTTKQTQYVVPLKLPFYPSIIKDVYYEFSNDSTYITDINFSSLKDSVDISKKFIVIGTPNDLLEVGKEDNKFLVPGPYIVALALIDQLNNNKFTKPPYDNVFSQFIIIIFFGFFVCLIFAAIYKYIKILQTRPYIIAILSWVLGASIFIYLGYLLLEFVVIRPTLPAISMLWAALLSWHFTKKFLVTGIMEGSGIIDVFISYSRSESEWVKKNLYNPLNELHKPDGKKFNIFFDEKSIGIGENFTSFYMRKIVDSKLFIPVMSEDYYKKNHCRNEMDLAVKRKVEKLINLCIIALDYKYVPEEFTNINFIDTTKQKDFISTIKNELFKGIENNSNESRNNNQVEDNKSNEVSKNNETYALNENKQENKRELDAKKIILTDTLDEETGKGIIIINNGKGNLTITTKGVTLTLNGKKEKSQKNKKKNKKDSNKKFNKKKKGKNRKS